MNAPESLPTGMALLHDPILNMGTAFSESERDALGLRDAVFGRQAFVVMGR